MNIVAADYLPWVAVLILNAGYWLQIYKIHVHKEVRDLAVSSYIMFDLAYGILAYEAYVIDSQVFLIKNILTATSTTILIAMIWYHKDDEWHDDEDKHCVFCGNELEPHWTYCTDCGWDRRQGKDDELTVIDFD